MEVALHDSDNTGFPNLALMKLSADYKASGDNVSWFMPLAADQYDVVCSSKVFTFTDADPYLPDSTLLGGTGNNNATLPDDVEHICPDYDLYGTDYSMGFLTRGCPRKCKHCFVPEKEGEIRANADIDEFVRHKKVVLMDNNVLAHQHGIDQIDVMIRKGLRVDFNQGLDARLIDDGIARRLAALKWLAPLRLACDSIGQVESVRRAVTLLRWHNAKPRRFFCYVLVQDVDEAVECVRFLKGMDVDPFAQPFLNREGTPPTKEQRDFARWVNHKAVYNSTTWSEYK